MGLIRSIAKKALQKVTGAEPTPAKAPPAAAPPRPTPKAPEPPSAPVAAKAPEAPKPAPTKAPEAPKPPAPAAAVGKPAAPTKAAAKPDLLKPETEAMAGLFATINAGAQEIKERMEAGEPVVLLDVREPFETAGGVIPGAVLLPMGQLATRWNELASANEVICYCASGVRSVQAATFLRERGLFNATSLEGGISEWMAIGGKIVRPG